MVPPTKRSKLKTGISTNIGAGNVMIPIYLNAGQFVGRILIVAGGVLQVMCVSAIGHRDWMKEWDRSVESPGKFQKRSKINYCFGVRKFRLSFFHKILTSFPNLPHYIFPLFSRPTRYFRLTDLRIVAMHSVARYAGHWQPLYDLVARS